MTLCGVGIVHVGDFAPGTGLHHQLVHQILNEPASSVEEVRLPRFETSDKLIERRKAQGNISTQS
ncbi:MAG: hypothetical protein AUF79_17760 [Crenarchaeota archaeon 13_1_20CM_2_51_8]|nr:MAG: hypothetical protein AUF79_17760 [Crenarchaeota archaeon 13_1_20CM_2_51_8]